MNLFALLQPIVAFALLQAVWATIIAIVAYTVIATGFFLVAQYVWSWEVAENVAEVLLWPQERFIRFLSSMNPSRIRRERLFKEVFGFNPNGPYGEYATYKARQAKIDARLAYRARQFSRADEARCKSPCDKKLAGDVEFIRERFWDEWKLARQYGYCVKKSPKGYLD